MAHPVTARRRGPLVVGTALVLAVALVAGFWWSRRGEGDASDGPDHTRPALVSATGPATAPVLRPATATPGRAVLLTHPSLVAGQATTVTITDGATVIEYPLTPSNDGAATMVAPPWVDVATGRPGPGTYDVSVAGSPAATLSIGEPADSIESAPGAVTRTVLAQARTDLEASEPNLDRLRDELDADTADISLATEALLADLDAQLAGFDANGTLQLVGGPSGTVVLTSDDLALMDRLLSGYLIGLVEQLEASRGMRGFAARSVGGASHRVDGVETAAMPTTTQEQLDLIRRLRAQITGGATVVTGAAAMFVTALAALYGGAAFGASALFALLAGVGTTVVIGTAAEGLAALEAFVTGGSWEFGAAFTGTMLSAFLDLGVALGTEVNVLINLASFLYTGHRVRNALYHLVCSSRPIPERFEDFCAEQALIIAAAGPLSIGRAWMSPEVIPPGRTGTLFVPISTGPSDDVSLNIEWGTGGFDDTVTVGDSGILRFPHTFADDLDGIFTIKLHAIDEEMNEAFQTAKVLVTRDVEVAVTATEIPVQLVALDSSTWRFELTNGQADYTVTVNFGDGTVIPLAFSTNGSFTVDHAYRQAGRYPLRVDVTDGLGSTASFSMDTEVREDEAVTYGDVEFPKGEISFADRVVEYVPGDGVESPYDSGDSALGPPDDNFVALGNSSATCESSVTFEFVDNYLTDVPGPDLWVFEVGPAVEATDLFISNDLASWIELGRIEGSTRSVDISGSAAPGEVYRYVRLCDHPDGNTSPAPYAGPDIDAVGAIGTVERPADER